MTTALTIDSLRNGITMETGVRFRPNDFFLNKLYDGFLKNAYLLRTEDKIKTAVYSVSSAIARCASAGIDFTKDFDLITPIFRGGIPSITIDVKAIPRLLARRGWIYQDALVAIPAGGKGQFEECISNGRRLVVYANNGDRQPVINCENLTNGSIERFGIRISIGRNAGEMIDFYDYVPTSEIIAAANASESGIFAFKYEKYKDEYGNDKRRKVFATDANGNRVLSDKDAPWVKYTSTMVKKVCVRRLQATIRETFPDIGDVLETATMVGENQAQDYEQPVKIESEEIPAEKPENEFDFAKPTPEQSQEILDAKATYMKNPNALLAELEMIYKSIPDNMDDESRARTKSMLLSRHFALLFIASKQKTLAEKYPQLVDGIKWLWE